VVFSSLKLVINAAARDNIFFVVDQTQHLH